MLKIPLEKTILDISGKPIILPPTINKKGKRKNTTLRNYLMVLLSTRFPVLNNKEIFWTTELGNLFSDEKNKEVEISENKANFLRRIIEQNKIKIQLSASEEKETELFAPFELAQVLEPFLSEEERKEINN